LRASFGFVRDPGDALLRIDCMTFFDANRVVEKSRRKENTPGWPVDT
jgi:hypothetical protein